MESQTSHRKEWNMPGRDLVLDQAYQMTPYVKNATESFYGRAPGTGAALRPVLAGIKAMSGTMSAKRCVKLAPFSVAEARQVEGQGPWPRLPLGRHLDEHRGETPPHIVC